MTNRRKKWVPPGKRAGGAADAGSLDGFLRDLNDEIRRLESMPPREKIRSLMAAEQAIAAAIRSGPGRKEMDAGRLPTSDQWLDMAGLYLVTAALRAGMAWDSLGRSAQAKREGR
jgi:predicted transcriptional regulator